MPISELSFADMAREMDRRLNSDESLVLADTEFVLVVTYPPWSGGEGGSGEDGGDDPNQPGPLGVGRQGPARHGQAGPSGTSLSAMQGGEKRAKIGRGTPGLMARQDIGLHVWERTKRCLLDPTSASYRLPLMYREFCLPLAVSNGIKRVMGSHFSSIVRFEQSVECRDLAEEIVERAGLGKRKGPFELGDIAWIQSALVAKYGEQFQVNVYDDQGPPLQSFGPSEGKQIKLFVYYPQLGSPRLHCCLITSMSAFFGTADF